MILSELKTHGGKSYLGNWILNNGPIGWKGVKRFVELFGGGGVLTYNRPVEDGWYNDLNPHRVVVKQVIRDRVEELVARLRRIEYSWEEFSRARLFEGDNDPISLAIAQIIRSRMSRGGTEKSFAFSTRLRGGQPGDENAWLEMIDRLPTLSERLRKVRITNQDAVEILRSEELLATDLIYLDPPYVEGSRVTMGEYGSYEFKRHEELLDAAKSCGQRVMISNYRNDLYAQRLKGWRREQHEIVNHSGQGKKKGQRIEQLWCNF